VKLPDRAMTLKGRTARPKRESPAERAEA
jgi:hypothetical protein